MIKDQTEHAARAGARAESRHRLDTAASEIGFGVRKMGLYSTCEAGSSSASTSTRRSGCRPTT